MKLRKKLGQRYRRVLLCLISRFYIAKNEKRANGEWSPFIHAKYIFVEDNYAERICGRGSSLRFVPFLITVFHLKSLPSYHETSCISLFMYEKWFKAARESSREKIRVAISKASFPGSGSLHP